MITKPPDNSVGLDANASKVALKHSNVLGAGAKKRKSENLNASQEYATIMKERNRGTLHSGSGAIVKSPAQAKAIAYSELKARGK